MTDADARPCQKEPKLPSEITYLTYLEAPGGVYQSQVIDLCDHFESHLSVRVKLVAVLSRRNFYKHRSRILERRPGSVVIFSPFGWRAWPLAFRALKLLLARTVEGAVIARGPVATKLALALQKRGKVTRVCYDGRGAVAAEWSEYDVAPSRLWRERIAKIEERAVMCAHARIAVSGKLVDYWRERFGYRKDTHAVIPCTIDGSEPLFSTGDEIAFGRRALGIDPGSIVICYSGSAAEWQSLSLLDAWLCDILTHQPNVYLLMMTNADLSSYRLGREFADRMTKVWVDPRKVAETMALADYGLLLREQSVTNRVAAPTKFAEYLSSGIPVIISQGIGDYSDQVVAHDLGIVSGFSAPLPTLNRLSAERRRRLVAFAHANFSKAAFEAGYRSVLTQLEG